MKSSIISSNEQRTLEKNPYFIVYFNLWFSKSFKTIFFCSNGITLLFMSKKFTQLSILIDIMNP